MALFDEEGGFGTDPNGYARRRSSISAFSADGNGNFSRTYAGPETGGEAQRQEWGADYDDAMAQRQVAGQFADLLRQSRAVQQHNARLKDSTVNSMMLSAMQNGGRIPQNTLGLASRNMGFDGKNQAIYSGGFLNNGNFLYDIATRGQNGGISTERVEMTPDQVYAAMYGSAGIWADHMDAVDNAYKRARYTHAASEIPSLSAFDEKVQNIQRGAQARQSQVNQKESAATLQEFMQHAQKMKRQGKSAEEFITDVVNSKYGLPFFSNSGEKMYEDKDGNPVENPFEEDGKTLKSGVRPAVDENGNQRYRQLGQKETLANIMDVWQNAQAAQGANGGRDDTDKWISLYRELYGPKPLSPEEQEIVQRQRQNAVEDQRRADNMRGPQQLVRYTDANGRLVTGNGWIRDGKVYDANGYEVQGATPMTARLVPTGRKDANGNDIMETRYEEMPRQEPVAENAAQENLGADGQPPAQDGAALLQQMRGGGQPPAQGATQAAQGGATAQPQTPEDKARAALAKRRGNAGGSPMMPNATQGGNATDRSGNGVNASENPAPATRRLSNKHRLGIFKDSGGEYEENAGGFRTVTIGNYDYLSNEDRAANSKVARENKDADIDIDALLKLQEKANSNKAEFDKKRLAEENAYRKSIASKNYTEKRMEAEIQKHMEEWDEKNDPRIVNNRDVMNGGSGPIRLF